MRGSLVSLASSGGERLIEVCSRKNGGHFPGGPVVKNPPSNAGDAGLDPWSGN